jgi:hypothetical protein
MDGDPAVVSPRMSAKSFARHRLPLFHTEASYAPRGFCNATLSKLDLHRVLKASRGTAPNNIWTQVLFRIVIPFISMQSLMKQLAMPRLMICNLTGELRFDLSLLSEMSWA